MECPTIKIKLGDEGDYTLINAAEFDAARHTKWTAKRTASPPAGGKDKAPDGEKGAGGGATNAPK